MVDTPVDEADETHASMGGAMVAGATTGGLIGMAAGPVGAAVGAVGGAILGAVSERIMHGGDGHDHVTGDEEHWAGDHVHSGDTCEHDHRFHYDLGYDEEGRRMEGTGDETLTRRDEELRPRRESVETGSVRVERDVVTEQRTLDVPVTREEVYVERRPVDRHPVDVPIREGSESIEVPVREERVTVERTPVAYEEVTVGTREVPDTQTVRREVADVRRDDEAPRDSGWRRDAI